MFTQTILQSNGDIECAASGDGAAHTGHGDHSNVLHLNVSRRLGDEHKTLVQEVQETLVGFDGALDSVVTVVAGIVLDAAGDRVDNLVPDEVLGRHNDLLSGEATEDLRDDLVNRLFVMRLQLVLVLTLHNVPMVVLADRLNTRRKELTLSC